MITLSRSSCSLSGTVCALGMGGPPPDASQRPPPRRHPHQKPQLQLRQQRASGCARRSPAPRRPSPQSSSTHNQLRDTPGCSPPWRGVDDDRPRTRPVLRGRVRKKNVLATLMQSFAITCLVTLLWYVNRLQPRLHARTPYIGGLSRLFMNGVIYIKDVAAAAATKDAPAVDAVIGKCR